MQTDGEHPPNTIAAQPAPLSFSSGRYVVRRLIGEGGQKTVYLAHDAQLARDVAIALLKTDGLDALAVSRVQREAQAMARLGTQPHIVTIFDIGEHEGRPYTICEYMAGGDLFQELRQAEGNLPLQRALQLAHDLTRALVVAHAHGILHRDIKPANVWLTEAGIAKLGDFGLAVAPGASRMTQKGTIMGTAAYMPPEQALGADVDERSDLYSLGCVLYELVTGRPPFLGDDLIAVISQHINTAPVAPSWHRREVPQAFERLILRLLAKPAADRPANAVEVLATLGAISAAPEAQASRSDANPLDRLASGAFVGRDKELAAMRTAFDEALAGRGKLVLLAGEPGIGKTRLSEELVTYAQVRGARVLWARCYEGEGAPAYWPWVQAVRAYVAGHATDALLADLGAGAGEISQIVSDLREHLPDLPTPAPLDPEQARFRLFDSITTFLKNAARRQPLVLVLDDLHGADKPSLLLLQFLAREIADCRFFILGTYRDVELGRQHPLSHTLAELTREQLSTRIVLHGLGEAEIARFIEISAGIDPPAAMVATVAQETEGNPFFVKEVVSLLASNHRLEAATASASWTLAIPESVRDVVGRRLDQLSEECNKVLTIASVIGREFNAQLLEGVAGIAGDPLFDILDEACGARIIDEVTGAFGSYRFSHALIRETLREELTSTRRVRLHRQIGEALERLYGAKPDAYLPEFAYHFSEAARAGGDVDKAIEYCRRAGDRAMEVLAWEEATGHFERALENLELAPHPDSLARCELLVRLGEAQSASGESDSARVRLHEAVASIQRLAPEEARRPQLLGRAGLALSWVLDFDDALKTCGSAAELIAASESPDAAAEYLARAARISFGAGFMRGAWELAAQGLRFAGEHRDATWAQLMSYEILRREAADPDNPGIPLDSPERREADAILQRLPAGQHAHLPSAYTQKADILARGTDDPVALVFLAGEYRRGVIAWQELADKHERTGQFANALSDWAQIARCHNALGDFAAAQEACDRATAFGARLTKPSHQALQLVSARLEMRFTKDPDDAEAIVQLEPLSQPPAVESQWASAALRAVSALGYAWTERPDKALYWLETLVAPLQRAPAWAPNYPLIACLAAYTLWILRRDDHIDVIERNIREKVVEPDFHFPMQNGALSLARLCALTGRFDDAADWFGRARAVLDDQGARPLRAVVDFDEGQAYHRLGDAESARPHLEAALGRFQELGMAGWVRRAEGLLA